MRKNGTGPAPDDKSFVAALQKGLDVLTCFSRQATRLTLTEVARLTGSTPASARRSLYTLHALGYLDSDGKRFWVAPRTLLLAHSYLASRPVPQLAQPLLDALAERTRQSASLGKLLEDDVIIIARSTARRSLSTGLGIGARLPAYCSALGQVLLASLPEAEAERRVRAMPRPALTPQTVTDADAVLARVARCRSEGWSQSDGELELGVRSLAVPVYERGGAIVAGLSMSVRAERMAMAEFRDAFLPTLLKSQQTLRERLYGE